MRPRRRRAAPRADERAPRTREGCVELSAGFPGVGLDERLFFMFRAYVNPGLAVSPGPGELRTERVIKLLAP